MLRVCRFCGQEKELNAFPKNGKYFRYDCLTCANKRRAKRPFKYPSSQYYRKSKYGLSEEAYQDMIRRQQGACACCHEVKRLVIDHDHDTGKIRGLLCSTCNTGLGHFSDSLDKLQKAIVYLESCA